MKTRIRYLSLVAACSVSLILLGCDDGGGGDTTGEQSTESAENVDPVNDTESVENTEQVQQLESQLADLEIEISDLLATTASCEAGDACRTVAFGATTCAYQAYCDTATDASLLEQRVGEYNTLADELGGLLGQESHCESISDPGSMLSDGVCIACPEGGCIEESVCGAGMVEHQMENGFPAVESPLANGGGYGEPWGTALGQNMENMTFQDCDGNVVSLWDIHNGASVSWTFYTTVW